MSDRIEIEQHDRDTIAYLRAVGVEGALLARVERLAQRFAELKAREASSASSLWR